MVRDLRREREKDDGFPEVLFVFQGSAEQGEAFFRRFWPGARGIADPERELYHAFGRTRATPGKLLSPGVLLAGVRATLKGNLPGRPVGDVLMMPGLVLFEGGRLVASHEFRHIGERRDYRALVRTSLDARPE